MTEKRFTYMIDRVFDLWAVYDNKEKVICLVRNTDAKDLCDLLNELHEENKKLKPVNEMLQMDLAITERNLMKENEQLKSKNRGLQSELQIFKEDVTHSNLQINKLTDENKQLKKELESFKPIIFESDGKPVTLYKKGDVE